uniref:Uncharacterized protein n=1 Tax=Meloidogyne enterolobii TaxID=390850 RepID=A0A6V7Y3U5_MELEN|nr:unnamed protein product [Meloidogyne enterolobii]
MQQNNSSSEKIDGDCEQNKEISFKKPVKLEKKESTSKSSLEQTITNPPVDLNLIKIVEEQVVKKQQLWKLIRGKFLITFYLCQDCQNKLFYSKDKFEENPDCVTVKIGLCNNCVKANSIATDVLAPYKKIGTKRKAE